MNTCKATLRVLFSHRAYLLIYLVFVGVYQLVDAVWHIRFRSRGIRAGQNACRRHRSRLGQGRHRVIDAHIPVGFQRTGER